VILVTGAAGFIGFHVARRLLDRGEHVVGVDNLNSYYSTELKRRRLSLLQGSGFEFAEFDIADRSAMAAFGRSRSATRIVHLAAQAGVRYSLTNPDAYIDSNLVGFGNILEIARQWSCEHVVYASSSSVYGANARQPFSEHDNVDHPLSLYAATKKANELMAHAYAHLYGIPLTGLRFFTVYGPWGRPDMALFRFARGILKGEPIPVYNHGRMIRDFTYIDDVAEGVLRVLDSPATPQASWDAQSPDPARSSAPYAIHNIGNNKPIQLMDTIRLLEEHLGSKAKLDMLPMQPGDVPSTMADVSGLEAAVDYRPTTTIETGISKFAEWFLAEGHSYA
jgi:UDP-glucuronate 4-epimerase